MGGGKEWMEKDMSGVVCTGWLSESSLQARIRNLRSGGEDRDDDHNDDDDDDGDDDDDDDDDGGDDDYNDFF